MPCLLLLLFIFVYRSCYANHSTDSQPGCITHKDCVSCEHANDSFGRCDWCQLGNTCVSSLNICPPPLRTQMAYNCATSIKAAFHYNETFAMKVALPLMAASAAPDHQTTMCFAFMTYWPIENAIIVTFRASTVDQVLPQIIGFAFEKMRGIPVVGGSVDIYYHDAFTKFWKLMEPVVRDATDKYTEAEVWFFGHSLGGGLASIASTVVSAKKMVLASRIKLITFGQPRVTDNLFAQRHDQLVPYSFRIINRHDGFTSMPARLPDNQKTGPFHHRYEVWYPKGMGPGAKFIASAMPEDGFGHESTAAILNVNDHLAMFGKVIGEWWQRECKD